MSDYRYSINEDIEADVFGFPSGLVGIVSVQIVDINNNVVMARTTAGVQETPTGSGHYRKVFVGGLSLPGSYNIYWDRGLPYSPSKFVVDNLEIVGIPITEDIIPGEILATLNDVNANYDGVSVIATAQDEALPQISVARIVKGYLRRVYSSAVVDLWTNPDATPDLIREIAAKLIAAQIFFNKIATTTVDIENTNYGQRLYDQAMKMLNNLISGNLVIEGIDQATPESITSLDFWPADATDRAFTTTMEL